MAPSASAASASAAAQDTFDANLNKAVFTIALALAVLCQSCVALYLVSLMVRKCCFARIRKEHCKGEEASVERGGHKMAKEVPRPLLLPELAAATAPKENRKYVSPIWAEDDLEDTLPLGALREKYHYWNTLRYSPSVSNTSLHEQQCSESLRSLVTPVSLSSSLVEGTSLTVQIDLGLEKAVLSSGNLEAKLRSSLSMNAIQSAMLSSTVVEIIEPSDACAPRIVVEDFAPPAATFAVLSDSDFDSDVSSSSSSLANDAIIQDDHFLLVPPMSWVAPRSATDPVLVAYTYTDPRDSVTPDDQETTSPQTEKTEAKSVSSRVMSVLSDISNVARLRPKLAVLAQATTTLTTEESKTEGMARRARGHVRTRGWDKENGGRAC
jgi:hypothetical protein